jgi:hypothetical protein
LGLVVLALLALWLAHAPAASAQSPTVSELLKVCDRGQDRGWVGVDAAFCDWYTLPCDCKLRQRDEGPRWCLPEAENALDAARAHVLAELRQLDSAALPAEQAVARLLTRLYPCSRRAP